MPRSLLLMSSETEWSDVEAALRELQKSEEFVLQTFSVIETWCPCVSDSLIAVRVFSADAESARRAKAYIVRKVREAIEATGRGHVSLSGTTVLGSTVSETKGINRAIFNMKQRIDAFLIDNHNERDSTETSSEEDAIIDSIVLTSLFESIEQIRLLASQFSGRSSQAAGDFGTLSQSLEKLRQQMEQKVLTVEVGKSSSVPGAAQCP